MPTQHREAGKRHPATSGSDRVAIPAMSFLSMFMILFDLAYLSVVT
jgi:hypothetical protein